MATEAIQPNPATRVRPLYRPVNRGLERGFFAFMAVLLCAVVFIGFAPTYFRAGVIHAPLPSPILHYHGAVFTLWMALFVVQTALISARRVAWHRSFGIVAFCLPPIMIVLGVLAALDALARGVRIGPLDPFVSLSIPLIGIVWFTVLIYQAWSTRRRPDAHKRLVLLATIALCDAALGRFPWDRIGLAPAAGAVVGLAILIVPVVIYDLVALHRVHRTTMWAAPITLAVGAFSVPIGMTPAWHSFAGFLLTHVAHRF
ncbi:MAG TPA: hypothetical protein VL346_11890 [Acidobacteriaceae bacterium]|nr:hypothetical protein [Acidobacteriaceae bacterium]